MHHTTTVGPVLDENDKSVPGKTFAIKGLLESNHAGELLSEDEFAALVADDISFKRTSGGGFEYSIEVVVSEQRLARVVAGKKAVSAAQTEENRKTNEAAEKAARDAELEAAKQAAFEDGRKAAILEQAKAAGAASVKAPSAT